MKRNGTEPREAKLLLRVDAACERGGFTRTRLFELLRQGDIESIRLGKQRLISARSLEGWVEAQLAKARGEREHVGV